MKSKIFAGPKIGALATQLYKSRKLKKTQCIWRFHIIMRFLSESVTLPLHHHGVACLTPIMQFNPG